MMTKRNEYQRCNGMTISSYLVTTVALLANLCCADFCPDFINKYEFTTLNTPPIEATYDYNEFVPLEVTTYEISVAPPKKCAQYISYTCEFVAGAVDLCDVESISPDKSETTLVPVSVINREKAVYTLMTIDIDLIPPGTYSISITGTTDVIQDGNPREYFLTTFVDITLVDPCIGNEMVIPDPPVIPIHIIHYLDEGVTELAWTDQSIVTQNTPFACGARTITFTFTGPNGITSDDRGVGATADDHIYSFISMFWPADSAYISEGYTLSYTVTDIEYDKTVTLESQVSIRERCQDPFSVTASTMTNIFNSYTILQDSPLLIQVPAFTVDPARCPITYTQVVNNSLAQPAYTFNDNTLEFEVFWDADVSPVGVHTITVTGISGSGQASLNFFLAINDPCNIASFTQVTPPATIPSDTTYYVGTYSQAVPFAIRHTNYAYGNQEAIDFCGQPAQIAYIDGIEVTQNTLPLLVYDSSQNILSIWTDQKSDVGPKRITIGVSLGTYVVPSSQFTFQLNVLWPCTEPTVASINVPNSLPQPADYLYTGSSPSAFFQPFGFTVYPTVCSAVYSCNMVTLASFDLCQIGVFDETTGNWSFSTTDRAIYPPGTYTMELTGAITDDTSIFTTHIFQVKFVDPCTRAQVTLLFPPFDDQVMFFFDSQSTFYYEILAEYDTTFDCGAFAIDFVDANDRPLNPAIFSDGSDSADPQGIHRFDIYPPQTADLINTQIVVTYRVYLEDYPSQQSSDSFMVEFILADSCDERLIEQNILSQLDESCQDPVDPEEPTNPEDPIDPEEPTNPEDPIDPEDPEQPDGDGDPEGPSEEEIEDFKEAAEFMPRWMRLLTDQKMVLGGDDLVYGMGDPVNYQNDLMDVKVDFGDLWFSSFHTVQNNSISFINDRLETWAVGSWDILIEASFTDLDGTLYEYSKTIILTILDEQTDRKQNEEDDNQSVNVEIGDFDQEFQDDDTPSNDDEPQSPDGTSGSVDDDSNMLPVDSQIKDGVPVYNYTYDVIYEEEGLQRARLEGPKPFVKSFSWNGKLTVGWASEIVPYAGQIEQLPNEKVAIETAYFSANDNRRRLQSSELDLASQRDSSVIEVWEDSDFQKRLQLLITDAIKISILKEDPDGAEDIYVETGFSWEVESFDSSEMTLQFTFDEPSRMSERSAVNFDTFKLTFFETKYFKDTQNREVPFGTELKWKVFRQIKESEANQVTEMSVYSQTALYMIGLMILVLALCLGPLVPVWMFFNSLQLFAHLPMIRANIPPQANIFLLDYLSIVRLQITYLTNLLEEQLIDAEDLDDYNQIERAGEGNHYNELFYSCGYHVSLVRNLILVFCLCLVVIAIWLLVASKDLFGCRKKNHRHEAWWNNTLIRILYEVFFEITICLLISFSVTGLSSPDSEHMSMWNLSLALTVIVFILLCSLSVCCFRAGPYARKTYATSAWTTYWSIRGLKSELLQQAQKTLELSRSSSSSQSSSSLCEYQLDNQKAKSDLPIQRIESEKSQSEKIQVDDINKSFDKSHEFIGYRPEDKIFFDTLRSKSLKSYISLPGQDGLPQALYQKSVNKERQCESIPNEESIVELQNVSNMPSVLEENFVDSRDQQQAEGSPMRGDIDLIKYTTDENFRKQSQAEQVRVQSQSNDISEILIEKKQDQDALEQAADHDQFEGGEDEALSVVEEGQERSATVSEEKPECGKDLEQQLNAAAESEKAEKQLDLQIQPDFAMVSEEKRSDEEIEVQPHAAMFNINTESANQIEKPFIVTQSQGEDDDIQPEIEDSAELNDANLDNNQSHIHQSQNEESLHEPSQQVENPEYSPLNAQKSRHISSQSQHQQLSEPSQPINQKSSESFYPVTYRQQSSLAIEPKQYADLTPIELPKRPKTVMTAINEQDFKAVVQISNTTQSIQEEEKEMSPDCEHFDGDDMLATDRAPDTARELLKSSKDMNSVCVVSSQATYNKITKPASKYAVEAARLAELAVEAQLRVTIAGEVKISKRYETLFYGLKKNHPHNAAVVHPMTFLVRRLVYACIIIFMFDQPFFASVILLVSSLLILCWVLTVSQWEHSLINQQHIVNEIALYVCLVLLLLCNDAQTENTQRVLGWIFIAIMCLVIAYNLIVIAHFTCAHAKLYITRCFYRRRNRRQRRSKNNQVMPVMDADDDQKVQKDNNLMDEESHPSKLIMASINFKDSQQRLMKIGGTFDSHRLNGAVMLNPISEEPLSQYQDGTDEGTNSKLLAEDHELAAQIQSINKSQSPKIVGEYAMSQGSLPAMSAKKNEIEPLNNETPPYSTNLTKERLQAKDRELLDDVKIDLASAFQGVSNQLQEDIRSNDNINDSQGPAQSNQNRSIMRISMSPKSLLDQFSEVSASHGQMSTKKPKEQSETKTLVQQSVLDAIKAAHSRKKQTGLDTLGQQADQEVSKKQDGPLPDILLGQIPNASNAVLELDAILSGDEADCEVPDEAEGDDEDRVVKVNSELDNGLPSLSNAMPAIPGSQPEKNRAFVDFDQLIDQDVEKSNKQDQEDGELDAARQRQFNDITNTDHNIIHTEEVSEDVAKQCNNITDTNQVLMTNNSMVEQSDLDGNSEGSSSEEEDEDSHAQQVSIKGGVKRIRRQRDSFNDSLVGSIAEEGGSYHSSDDEDDDNDDDDDEIAETGKCKTQEHMNESDMLGSKPKDKKSKPKSLRKGPKFVKRAVIKAGEELSQNEKTKKKLKKKRRRKKVKQNPFAFV